MVIGQESSSESFEIFQILRQHGYRQFKYCTVARYWNSQWPALVVLSRKSWKNIPSFLSLPDLMVTIANFYDRLAGKRTHHRTEADTPYCPVPGAICGTVRLGWVSSHKSREPVLVKSRWWKYMKNKNNCFGNVHLQMILDEWVWLRVKLD